MTGACIKAGCWAAVEAPSVVCEAHPIGPVHKARGDTQRQAEFAALRKDYLEDRRARRLAVRVLEEGPAWAARMAQLRRGG